jgi:hypothetical protein
VQFVIDHLDGILRYSLSFDAAPEFETPADFRRVHRDCLKLLIESPTTFRFKLAQSATLWELLATFRANCVSLPQILIANFCKIIWALADATFGACLAASLPDLGPFLVANLGLLCVSDLFTKLASRFPSGLGFGTDLILDILNGQRDARAAFSALKATFKNPDFKAEIDDSIVLRITDISVALIDDQPFVSLEGFQLVSLLLARVADSRAILGSVRERLQGAPIANRSRIPVPAILALAPRLVEQYLECFLSEENTTMFNDAVCRALSQLPVTVLQELAGRHSVMQRIMDSYPRYLARKTNGHLLSLAGLLNSQHVCSPPDVRERWAAFAQGELRARVALVNRAPTYIEAQVKEVVVRRESAPRARPVLDLLKS